MRDQSALHVAFLDFAHRATGTLEVDSFTRHLASTAVGVLGVDCGAVMLRSGTRMRYAGASSSRVDAAERVQDALQQGPCRDAERGFRTVVEPDLAQPGVRWPAFAEQAVAQGLRAVAAVPMRARDEVRGVLDIYRASPGPFPEEELETARALANGAVGYLVLAADRDAALQAQRELAHAATHDALTGLPNRTLLYDRLEHALLAGRRLGTVVAAIYLDLDRFKDVNDTHGHHMGDALLVEVAHRFKAIMRQGDTLARIGGDEFVVVCEGVRSTGGEPGGRAVASLLTRITAVLSRPVRRRGVELTVSASLGVAVAGPGCDDPESLLHAADAAMYDVKRAARTDSAVVDLGTRRIRRSTHGEGLPHLDSNQEPAG